MWNLMEVSLHVFQASENMHATIAKKINAMHEYLNQSAQPQGNRYLQNSKQY